MPVVLVVDDEANIRELVTVYFTAAGFEVRQAADGRAGLDAALAGGVDLVILDIMLPGLDGAEVCRSIRAASAVPVIMLTARDTMLDKVALLELGADDYVVKPFDAPELVARARAVLRRAGEHAPARAGEGPVTLGGLELDPATREVRVDGEAVELTAKEFDLLFALVSAPGIVLSRERLLEAAWGFADYVEARGVDVHIRHIRAKLGDDADSPRFIETVRGVGYRARRGA